MFSDLWDPISSAGSPGSFGDSRVSGFHASAMRWQQLSEPPGSRARTSGIWGGWGGGTGSFSPRRGPRLAKDKLSDIPSSLGFSPVPGKNLPGAVWVFCYIFHWFATHMSGVKSVAVCHERTTALLGLPLIDFGAKAIQCARK